MPYILFTKSNLLSSDEKIHLLYIDAIRKNKHRFILTCESYLVQKQVSYPQFIHWCLSFFSSKTIRLFSKFFPLLFSLLSTIAFCLFAIKIYHYIDPSYISIERFLFIGGLIFISTPFTYSLANSKNLGISARGLGLFLGQVYTYSLVLFDSEPLFFYLAIAFFSALIIILSNQIGMQYILFSTPFFAIFYSNIFLIGPLLLAVSVFFVTFPKISLQFWKGQFAHKLFYYKYIYQLLIKNRASIWGDVGFYIWKQLFSKILSKEKPKKWGSLIMYIYTNSVIILIFMIPLTLPIAFYYIFCFYKLNANTLFLFYPIFVGLGFFLLFSFKRTRFLGQPERYPEFTIGFMAVLFLLIFKEVELSILLIIYQLLLVVFQLIIIKITSSISEKSTYNKLYNIETHLISCSNSGIEVRLLSNNTNIIRFLTNSMIKVFYGSLNTQMYGRFHYKEIYHDFDRMKNEKIIPIIDEFSINYFVLDIKFCSLENFQQLIAKSPFVFREIFQSPDFIFYEVHRNN